jgi:hypothetical protein
MSVSSKHSGPHGDKIGKLANNKTPFPDSNRQATTVSVLLMNLNK